MKITLATEGQIHGNKALGVFRTYGTKTGLSDLAIILGTFCSCGDTDILGNLAGWAWTSSSFYNEGVCIQGSINTAACEPCFRNNAIRPVIPPSEAQKIPPSQIIFYPVQLPNGRIIQMAKFGEYPQIVADEIVIPSLERELEQGTLIKTGKIYTLDAAELENPNQLFTPDQRLEYRYGDAKFVRVKANPKDNRSILSNGEIVQKGKYYWIKVLSCKWLVDTTGWMISQTALLSGIQFDPAHKYQKPFDQTNMSSYLQNCFSVEILPTEEYLKQQLNFIVVTKHRNFTPTFQLTNEG